MLTKKDLAEYIASCNSLSKKDVELIVNDIFTRIKSELADRGEVSIHEFGKFSTKVAPAREGRNPATGKTIDIAETIKVKFTPSKTLKDDVN